MFNFKMKKLNKNRNKVEIQKGIKQGGHRFY